MGGDQHLDDLKRQCRFVNNNYPNLKLAIYTGANDMNVLGDVANYFEYIKLGPYIPELGGLNSMTTNQRLYVRGSGKWLDITHKFWRNI